MDQSLRLFVLNGKSIMSSDAALGDGCNVLMGKSDFKQSFMGRVRQAREARSLTQEEMATLLDIPQSKYHKYESRSYLPHDLVPRFCLAAGVEEHWLFTGRRRQAEHAEVPAAAGKSATPRRRRKSA
jgi:DNA-binding XRE family transcriptional regulator